MGILSRRRGTASESQPAAVQGNGAPHAEPRIQVLLFDSDAPDRELGVDGIDGLALTARQLLWVDVEAADVDAAVQAVLSLAARLGLDDVEPAVREALDGEPRVRNHGDWFLVQALGVTLEQGARVRGNPFLLLCGHNVVLTSHLQPLAFLQELRAREHADSRIGALLAERFSASLLGWLVDGYLEAISAFEARIDRMEVGLLANPRHRGCLPELASLRRAASRIRRLLAPHRAVFGAIARPDFRPEADAGAERDFRALEQRFERAMDAAENARDLLVGTFELYSTRSAERTNDTMRALTFVTVLLGTLAVFAGLLGMNFQVAFFETGARGFWTAVGSMAGFAALALLVARWRRWI